MKFLLSILFLLVFSLHNDLRAQELQKPIFQTKVNLPQSGPKAQCKVRNIFEYNGKTYLVTIQYNDTKTLGGEYQVARRVSYCEFDPVTKAIKDAVIIANFADEGFNNTIRKVLFYEGKFKVIWDEHEGVYSLQNKSKVKLTTYDINTQKSETKELLGEVKKMEVFTVVSNNNKYYAVIAEEQDNHPKFSFKVFDSNDNILLQKEKIDIYKDVFKLYRYCLTDNGNLLLAVKYDIGVRNLSGIAVKAFTPNNEKTIMLPSPKSYLSDLIFRSSESGQLKIAYTYRESKKETYDGFLIGEINENDFTVEKFKNIDVEMESLSSFYPVLEKLITLPINTNYVFCTAYYPPKGSRKLKGTLLRGILYKFDGDNKLLQSTEIDYEAFNDGVRSSSDPFGFASTINFTVSEHDAFYFLNLKGNLFKYLINDQPLLLDNKFTGKDIISFNLGGYDFGDAIYFNNKLYYFSYSKTYSKDFGLSIFNL